MSTPEEDIQSHIDGLDKRQEFQKATELYEALHKQKPSKKISLKIADSLRNHGHHLAYEKQFEEAKRKFSEALEHYRKYGMLAEEFKLQMAINRCESGLGNYNESMAGFVSLLKQCKNKSSRAALVADGCDLRERIPKIQLYLSITCARLGKWKEALENAGKAVKGFPDDYNIAQCLQTQGIALGALGEYNSALQKLRTARKIFACLKIQNQKTKLLLVDEHILAVLYKLKQYPAALGLAIQCIDTATQLKLDRPALYFMRGECRAHLGEKSQALADYLSAIKIIESHRGTIALDYYRQTFLTRYQKIYETTLLFCIRNGNLDEGYSVLQQMKARVFNEKVESGFHQQLFETPEFAGLKKIGNSIESLYDRIAGTDDGDEALRSQLKELEKKYERELRAIQEKHSDAADLVVAEPVDVRTIQGSVDKDTAVLEYCFTDHQLVIFCITREKYCADIIDIPSDQIKTMASNVRMWVFSVESAVNAQERQQREKGMHWYLKALHDVLIAPAHKYIKTAKRLIIIPYGTLHFLPFALLEGADGVPLIDRYEIVNMPGSRQLTKKRIERKQVLNNALVIANPTGDLLHAETEAASIASIISKAKLLTGDNASKEVILHELGNYSIVHFACHARPNESNPTFSELVVSGAKKGSQSRITVGDVLRTKNNAELVVLSGCETGIGDISQGDEITCFPRAFMYAGTRNVIVSLWEIEDASTAVFMNYLYKGLTIRKMPPSRALYYAQIKMKKDYSAYHWAGFQMIGE